MSSNEYFQAILHNFALGLNDRSIYGAGVSRPQTQKLRPPTPSKKSGETQTPPPKKKKFWKTQTPPPQEKNFGKLSSPPKKNLGKLRPPPPERTKKRHLKSEFGFFDFFD